MLDFITIPCVLGVIGFFTYKLFELFVCKKERLYMLEHIKDWDGVQKFLPTIGSSLQIRFSALKVGCLLVGLGLGMMVAYLICTMTMPYWFNMGYDNWRVNEIQAAVFGACTLLFGGLGLVIAFIVELKLRRNGEIKGGEGL